MAIKISSYQYFVMSDNLSLETDERGKIFKNGRCINEWIWNALNWIQQLAIVTDTSWFKSLQEHAVLQMVRYM